MATLAYLPSRGRWRVRWRATNRSTGALFSGSRVFLEKPQAAACWAEMEAQERLWRTGQVTATDSLAEALAAFESYCRRHTARTQEHYRRVLAAFQEGLPKNAQRFQQLDRGHIEEYLNRLRDRQCCNRTLNAHLTAIKAFTRWLSERHGVPNAAGAIRMLTEDPPDHRFITAAEYAALVAACCPLLYPPGKPILYDRILFLANTGLRVSEFCGLVRQGRLAPHLTALVVTGKGRRQRTVPLNRICRQILARPYIYRPIGRDRLYMDIAQAARRAGIPPLGPHALRHYCATALLLAGVPIIKVAKILGHSVQVCERTYAHILPQDLAQLTEVLDTSPL